VDDAAGEPVRTPFRMRGDHDLVRREEQQHVAHGEQRVGVADDTARVEAGFAEAFEAVT
jgi:hypothetical protein